MKANVEIVAKTVNDESSASISATIQVNAAKCFEAQGMIKSLILQMLASECIMNTFKLRACNMEYIFKHLTDMREDEFEVNVQIPKNIKPNQYAVDEPRPCETPHDTSTYVRIHVHFEKD